ncbi:MAG: hypothetical protein LKH76_04535 [Acetobacter fabarum]|jgi:hypothetical protein|uniref:Uncharacterized protein n=1 Tax=Acetobacter fabarum TaxID=483199 RepID=A0A269Y066_9PROT|nr:hypothetical protein [Acetobacter fabarum]MCH4026110.1 hypothetical protein [Acetobacter fabarum]MCH4054858.1 hypothetical protein [Acetobacter fabarum]MCH4086029.1 hypothetical protein [Acetobacter fabarum]MCH4127379.1 hypothetical protein [Acetobacter fabarum]MCH4136728.1 hypothetical protein [Acetobacter fabarum]
MSETEAPQEQGWKVRILDLSGGAEDNIVEEVGVFHDLAHANAFARAYVRDSVERCRTPGASAKDVLDTWTSFGEDAVVIDAEDDGWRSANELDDFTATPATPMERDWRMLDPRRLVDGEDILLEDEEDAGAEEDDTDTFDPGLHNLH